MSDQQTNGAPIGRHMAPRSSRPSGSGGDFERQSYRPAHFAPRPAEGAPSPERETVMAGYVPASATNPALLRYQDLEAPSGRHAAPHSDDTRGPAATASIAMGEGRFPPRPSDKSVSPVRNALVWLLVAFGGFCSVLASQVVFTAAGAIALMVVSLFAFQSFSASDLETEFLGPLMLVSEIGCLAVFLPWWRHLRRGSLITMRRSSSRGTAGSTALRIVAIVLMGIGFQLLVGYALTFLLPLVPDLEAEYTELMSDPVMNELTVLSLLVVAIGAPVTEELACRGVILEFALRAVCPAWSARWRDRKWCRRTGMPARRLPAVPSSRFWIANTIQALLFGVLHLNIVQGAYAFLLGLVLGWLVWRTGSLAWSMGLHLVVNFSSYFVSEISGAFEFAGVMPAVLLAVLVTVAGAAVFARTSAPSTQAETPARG